MKMDLPNGVAVIIELAHGVGKIVLKTAKIESPLTQESLELHQLRLGCPEMAQRASQLGYLLKQAF